jgi:hypothetical protein
MKTIARPSVSCGWIDRYIALAPEPDLLTALECGAADITRLFQGLSEADCNARYQPEKWSPLEILAHLTESELVFSYRALRFSRKDATPLPSYDENAYAAVTRGNLPALPVLLAAYRSRRESTLLLFDSMTDDMLDFSGISNGVRMSARCLGFAIAGHERHHAAVIRERYLSAAGPYAG